MNIIQFKRHAKVTEDNRESAAHNWAKTWGFDFWYNLWGYRTYELGQYKFKSGRVNMRHYGYTHTECYINGESVTPYKFKKELANEPIPTFTSSEPKRTTSRKRTKDANQLELAF